MGTESGFRRGDINMKINRQQLLHELLFVGMAVKRKNTIPVLVTVLLQAKDGNLKLTGTDLDLTIQTSFPTVTEDAEFCVSCFDLTNALKNSDSEDIEINKLDSRVELICGKNKFKLPFEEADRYPQMPEFETKKEITLNGNTLANALSLTSFACTEELSRFNFSGVFFKNNGKLNVWALDGYIVSFLTSKEQVSDVDFDFVIHQNSARAIAALCGKSESVKLEIEENHVAVESGNRKIITRKTIAKSPDIDLFRTANDGHSFSFLNKELIQSVRASQSLDDLSSIDLAVRSDKRFSKLAFERKDTNEISISSTGSKSSFEGSFKAKNITEFPVFKVNSFYLQKLLTAMPDGEIKAKTDGKVFNGFTATEEFEIEIIQQCLNV